MTNSKLTFSAAFLLGFASMGMNAAEVDFSYTYGADDYEMIGTGKTETYDVAIRITDSSLIGSKIKAFSVPFIQSDDISGISVWASKILTLENKVNVPDITSVEATSTDGTISVSFPEMIEIPEGGIYVGYSFTVDKKTDETLYPVAIGGEAFDEGLYMHTSRTYLSWNSYAKSKGGSSAITVTLDGDFYANALGISSIVEPFSTPGQEIVLNATVNNHGSTPVESIEYTVSYGDNTQTSTVAFDPIMQLYFGESFDVELPFTAPEEVDEYNLTVEITKVNGVENKDAAAKIETLLIVVNEVPVNRPLMEEYTCIKCGYCTRGYAAIEAMNSAYPDEFVAISYHNKEQGTDPMMRTNSFPQSNYDNPKASINRGDLIDPYFGNTNSGFGIEPYWQAIQQEFNPVNVKGAAVEAEDGSITVTSEISFVKSMSGTYKIAYAIIANGLKESDWIQTNYYAGYDPDNFIPEMAQFCKTGSYYVAGLVFNDIYAAGSDYNGVDDSIITDVKKHEVYSHTYSFGADDGISVTGYDLFRNAKELYAVIIVIDENNKPLNCNKVLIEGHTAGINGIVADGAEVNTEEYFNLNGIKVEDPSNGVFIKIVTKDNGEKTTSKVILK